jgi:hypothetical protein
VAAYLLNLFDLGCTLAARRLGVQELNPLMQCVPFMVFYKVVVIGVLCWWLHRRPEPLAKRGLQLCTLFYGILAVWHLYGLIII